MSLTFVCLLQGCQVLKQSCFNSFKTDIGPILVLVLVLKVGVLLTSHSLWLRSYCNRPIFLSLCAEIEKIVNKQLNNQMQVSKQFDRHAARTELFSI